MTKQCLRAWAGVCTVALLAGPLQAANWTLVGTPGFTGSNTMFTDFQRIRFNSIIRDNAGNIYATAQVGNNNGTAPGANAGGLTIFPAGGGPQIDVNVFSAGFPGAITRLVLAGDGAVYGLQNWLEINWEFNSGIPNRIIKITPTGGITEIFNSGTPTADNKRINGMTVGGDGYVYWTTSGWGTDVNDKLRYFWRYTAGSAAPAVQESPMNTLINNGFSEKSRMFDLEFVGRKNGIDTFAAMFANNNWDPFAMGWDKVNFDSPGLYSPPNYNYFNRRNANGSSNTGWRDRITAIAYDPANKKLWVGGRGGGTGSPWSQNDGNGSIIVDGANYYMRSNKTGNNSPRWRREINDASLTIGARLRINSHSAGYNDFLLHAVCDTGVAGTNSPWVGLTINPATSHLLLKNVNATGTGSQLADLGAFALGTFYEVSIHVNATTGRVRCWLDGAQVYDAVVADTTAHNGEVQAGAATTYGPADDAETLQADFDWIGYGPGEIPQPDNNWPRQKIASGGVLACYLDGNVLPENWRRSNVMTRWSGLGSEPALFSGVGLTGVNPDPMPGIAQIDVWHANGNDPDVENQSVGGNYWVNTIAINPCDGRAWLAWGGQQSNIGGPGYYVPVNELSRLGHVYTIDKDGNAHFNTTDEGAPAGSNTSQVVALYFTPDRRKVLASTVDLATGAYAVYEALNPGACCNDPRADVEPGALGTAEFGDGDVDMRDYSVFQECFRSGTPTGACTCLDYDNNGQVNDLDFENFKRCAELFPVTGPFGGTRSRDQVPAVPGCDE